MASNQIDDLLTTEEVSRWLKVPIRTICLWAECAELPAVKIGRHWRFRRTEVDEWLQKSRRLKQAATSGA
jgi:excisionase family DNA binding protein